MRDPSELTKSELIEVVRRCQQALWPGGDFDHPWNSDTLAELADAMVTGGLAQRPPPEEDADG